MSKAQAKYILKKQRKRIGKIIIPQETNYVKKDQRKKNTRGAYEQHKKRQLINQEECSVREAWEIQHNKIKIGVNLINTN